MDCKKKKASEYNTRLTEHIRTHTNGKFVTLTFNPDEFKKLSEIQTVQRLDGYERENEICKIAEQRFSDRWKKEYKIRPHRWLITELGKGKTEHIHMHGIIWTNEKPEDISRIWKYGSITIGKRTFINGKSINNYTLGYVNGETIGYIMKYITKMDFDHKEYKARIFLSPGIGREYINSPNGKSKKYIKDNTDTTYMHRDGTKTQLGRYLMDKIFTDDEKELIQIDNLNKNKRYIGKLEIDISTQKGLDTYEKIRNNRRVLNNRLGYGNNTPNYERRILERDKRNEKFYAKINKAKNSNNTPMEELKWSNGKIVKPNRKIESNNLKTRKLTIIKSNFNDKEIAKITNNLKPINWNEESP